MAQRVDGETPGWTSISADAAEVRMDLYVADGDGAAVPHGVVGELCLTADAEKADGARRIRTGDLGCEESEGAFVFLGRRSDERRFRGFPLTASMELLDAELSAHPDLREGAVCWDAGTSSLVACVVPAGGQEATSGSLDSWIRGREVAWLLPAHYVAVERLPRRADGSPDRCALSALLDAGHGKALASARHGGRTERQLTRIWKKLLNRRHVDPWDNFFVLGGDLVLGVEMAVRAQRAGIDVTPAMLFTAPTVSELLELASP